MGRKVIEMWGKLKFYTDFNSNLSIEAKASFREVDKKQTFDGLVQQVDFAPSKHTRNLERYLTSWWSIYTRKSRRSLEKMVGHQLWVVFKSNTTNLENNWRWAGWGRGRRGWWRWWRRGQPSLFAHGESTSRIDINWPRWRRRGRSSYNVTAAASVTIQM